MICFVGITPHTPLLIPGVGKENLDKLSKTVEALKRLSDELYTSKPDAIVVISSHATQHIKAFSLNLQDTYTMEFRDFGDLNTSKIFNGNPQLAAEIQNHMFSQGVPFTLDSQSALDYGTSVPLFYLLDRLPHMQITPISFSGLPYKDHVKFGNELKEVLDITTKRIAILASGDLSHCLTSDAPLGFKSEGKIYDDKVVEAVNGLSVSALLSMQEETIKMAQACIHEQLLILLGIIERKAAKVEVLSYEHPFGVGYLVAQIHI